MIKDKVTFLKKVALGPELVKNKLSLIFALYPNIDISKKEKFVENVVPFFNRQDLKRENVIIDSGKESIDLASWLGKDLRIKKIKISSVRGFPESDLPFGIDFTNENGEPQSMIILGSNGVGKSSIYNALEFNYCKSIGETKLRTTSELDDDDKEFKKYLEHFNNGFAKCYCEIDTESEKLSLNKLNIPQNIRAKINPETHFISDYDIYSNGQLDYENGGVGSFHMRIAKSLGLDELLEFERNIKVFSTYSRRTETLKISALEKNIRQEKEIITNNEKVISEKKEKLSQIIKTHKAQPKDEAIQDIIKLVTNIKGNLLSFTMNFPDLSEAIYEFRQRYKEFVSLEVKNGNISQVQFLNLGLELLKDSTSCPFCDNSKISINEIDALVRNKIILIQEFNKISQGLTKSFNIVSEFLGRLYNQIELIKNKVKQEVSSIKSYSEFTELTLFNNRFTGYLESNLSQEFFSIGTVMSQEEAFKLNRNQFLFSFLDAHKVYIDTELPKIMSAIEMFLSKRSELIIGIERNIATKSQTQSTIEQIAILNNEIESLNKQVSSAINNINLNSNELLSIREQQELFEIIKSEAREYYVQLHYLLNNEIQQAFAPIQEIVDNILNEYIKTSEREVNLIISMMPEDVDPDTGETLSEIITAHIVPKDNSKNSLPVNKYFNTFHYRLFSTIVGISIAIASRINTNINLPLVLDDIFYASDFENRALVESFIKKIFDIFNKFTSHLKLQVILFTHDQLIFESAIKATSKMQIENISFARLFPFKDSIINKDYKDLIYCIPTYLPSKILKTSLISI